MARQYACPRFVALFLPTCHLSIIYGDAKNPNLIKIHDNAYLYPGMVRN
jgi:hypothetical protein